MAPKYEKDQDTAYTNFTIKVDVGNNWTKTVEKVLSSVKGVTSFRMEDEGKVRISGYIEPNVLLKCLRKNGKNAHLVHWQYGESETNLYRNGYGGGYSNCNGYNNYYMSHQQGGYGGYNNNVVTGYNYHPQPRTTYVPSYPSRDDPYANHEESTSCCIM